MIWAIMNKTLVFGVDVAATGPLGRDDDRITFSIYILTWLTFTSDWLTEVSTWSYALLR